MKPSRKPDPLPAGLMTVPAGDLRWTLRTGEAPEWMMGALSDPDRCLAAAIHRFKDSPNVTIARLVAPPGDGPNLVLRRLNYGRLRHRLRDTFRRSRAQRALRMALQMEAAGVAVARGIGAADVRRWRWPLRAYLVTEEIRGGRTLAKLAASASPPERAWVTRLGRLIGTLHQRGFSHRDLKATNILIDQDGHPFLIDLDGVRQFRQVPLGRAVKDLARLVAGLGSSVWLRSPTLVRFLNAYCDERQEPGWRAWFKAIAIARKRHPTRGPRP